MKTTQRGAKSRVPIGPLLAAAVALGAVSAAGASATAAQAATNRQVVISAQNIGKFGKVLISNGTALYVLTPSATACGSKCLKIWPAVSLPAQVKSAKAGSGVQASKLGVTSGPGGIRQVTYNGQPLYWFYKDTKGHVKGNITDQWGKWTAVVAGKTSQSTPSSSNSGSGGGSTAGSGGVSF
jgi:predicted lipoprotein with Yx(FWY)xxD motif